MLQEPLTRLQLIVCSLSNCKCILNLFEVFIYRFYSPSTKVTCSNSYNPRMSCCVDRWFTFLNWPKNPNFPSPKRLSEAGFYYLEDGDRVRCFYCRGIVQNWIHNEDPWTEHAKRFPKLVRVMWWFGISVAYMALCGY